MKRRGLKEEEEEDEVWTLRSLVIKDILCLWRISHSSPLSRLKNKQGSVSQGSLSAHSLLTLLTFSLRCLLFRVSAIRNMRVIQALK